MNKGKKKRIKNQKTHSNELQISMFMLNINKLSIMITKETFSE